VGDLYRGKPGTRAPDLGLHAHPLRPVHDFSGRLSRATRPVSAGVSRWTRLEVRHPEPRHLLRWTSRPGALAARGRLGDRCNRRSSDGLVPTVALKRRPIHARAHILVAASDS
jgi:hypothetical protein